MAETDYQRQKKWIADQKRHGRKAKVFWLTKDEAEIIQAVYEKLKRQRKPT